MEERVPEIRFKGFNDTWQKSKLSSMCDMFTDGDWIEAQDQSDSGIRLIQTGNIGVTEYLDKPNHKKWISKDTFEALHCEEVFPGDILISRLPEPAGRACIVPELGAKMITAVDCTIVRPSNNISRDFLVQYLSSQQYFNEVNTCLAGGTRQRISRSNLANFDIPNPINKDEQQKIGMLLSRLDTFINLTQQKLDQLKTLKKACLEKMFPKEGSIVPEIRFAGFAEAWEQRKLGDVARILGGNAWKASDYSDDGEYLVVTIANVSGEVIINDSVGNRISCDNPDVYLLNKGDILVSLTGNVGRVSKMSNIKGLLNQRVGKILPNNSDINADFLFHVLRNPHFERAMIDAGQGAAQKNIRNDDVLNYAFFLPVEKDEQKQIGTFFRSLDNLITLQQHKLDKLKNLKKALLDKMFI